VIGIPPGRRCYGFLHSSVTISQCFRVSARYHDDSAADDVCDARPGRGLPRQRQKLLVFGSWIDALLAAFFCAGPGELLLGLGLSYRLLGLEMDSMRSVQYAVQ
jgi:hypothetical protein